MRAHDQWRSPRNRSPAFSNPSPYRITVEIPRSSGFSHAMKAFPCLQLINHIQHNRQIHEQQRNMEEVLPVDHFVDLEGKVKRAGNKSNPLRPGSGVPESVSLDE